MVVSCGYGCTWTIASSPSPSPFPFIAHHKIKPVSVYQKKKAALPNCCIVQSKVAVGIEDVTQIINNKVVIAAGVSSAIGQLAKPFTSSFVYGKRFDFWAAFQAGGFPSTHSSAVVATAASLGFERGFSDSVVGMSIVYAALVMYDAQGVRKEVGEHAKVINKVLLERERDSKSCQSRTQTPLNPNEGHALAETEESCSLLLLESDNIHLHHHHSKSITPSPLKESVGHTAVEVVAGAFLGFLVSFVLYTI